jgi:GAF domain-containing protein
MTIKAKLIANVLLTLAIIAAISLTSFFSMRFLQEKLSYLTEKSTPFQMRTFELQRELQGCIATLVKLNAARTINEYSLLQAEAEKSLETAADIQISLEKMSNSTHDVSNDLDKIALELFYAVEERINSDTAAAATNARVQQSLKESSDRLNNLDTSIRKLQADYSRSFAAALENTNTFSGKLRSIEELRNLVRELQLIAVTAQNAQKGSAALITKGKLKSVVGRISRNEYYTSNKSIAAITSGFTGMLAEYINLQSATLTQNNDESKNRAAASGKDLIYKLNDLFQTLDQETMLVRDELTLATGRQGSLFFQSGSANSILVANSELVALGLMLAGETNRLFTLDSLSALDKRDSEIRSLFAKINERVRMLDISLTRLNAADELKTLRAAAATLAAISNKIYSTDGIAATLKKKLNAIEQSNKSADKLRDIVIRQTAQGKESVSVARGEQEKSIVAMNDMIRRSLIQIVVIGLMTVVIGIFFGFWIYRSVLQPLRMVLGAVSRQQKHGIEKAHLAEAVSGGDLAQEGSISEAMTLDPAQMNKDEMGMVLIAVIGMNEAQIKLDKAFVGMTASLRSSRDEGIRRDRLKSGLYELNKILRNEQKTAELADRALAFLTTFLGAGVGIMYLYDEKEEMLQTLSTYAISRSGQLNDGFRLGESLAGQVAADRKMICLKAVPPDYLPITSALGEADPLNVVIMPIMHNDILVGVLEIGSFRPFDNDDFEFLNQSLEDIAIAINVNISRQLVNKLLEQTQHQAEELAVQQEELLQTNEELEKRARMLAGR